MKYSEIKTMEDLERAQRSVRAGLDAKKEAVRCSVMGVRESYSPSNIMMSGLRAVSSVIPVDRILLVAVEAIRKKFTSRQEQ
ncbi:MAG: hypothetical protein KBS78_01350 [Bacteroidales bacterium]|nr:hypothetical protein [Candidatus Cryptobacteroides faecihippi]